MTASRRRRPRSPASSPLDDEDMLSEILLRLPPQPSSLPRASLVCKSWRRLVSDPQFRRRFLLRHRRNPPLLGFFDRFDGLSFQPTLEAPNRVPLGRLPLQRDDGDYFLSLGCRQILVWDPVTGDQHRLSMPPVVAARAEQIGIHGAVYRAAGAGDVQQFQVVLAVTDGVDARHRRALACVYSSKTGLWGNLISTPIPYRAYGSQFFSVVFGDAVLAGGSLYWILAGNFVGILEFDLEKQSLAVIPVPVDMLGKRNRRNCFKLIRAEGGVLGFFFMLDSDCCTAQLWKRMTDCEGVASWVLARTIELDKLLSLKAEEKGDIEIQGFAEENNVLLLWTVIGLFMVHLESLKIKKLFETTRVSHYHLFESVYTAVTGIGGRHDASDLMHNK